jgi:hypothetical protein
MHKETHPGKPSLRDGIVLPSDRIEPLQLVGAARGARDWTWLRWISDAWWIFFGPIVEGL